MASVEAGQIPDEQRFMAEYWNFRKKFHQPEESDEYWTALIDESDELYQKYANTGIVEYVGQMILTCVNEIEQRWKKQAGSKYADADVLTKTYRRLKATGGQRVG